MIAFLVFLNGVIVFLIMIKLNLFDKGSVMGWQDLFFLIANIIIALGLVPQVKQGFKDKKAYVNFKASYRITIAMFLFIPPLFSLHFYFSGAVVIFNTIMWILLLYQSMKFEKA